MYRLDLERIALSLLAVGFVLDAYYFDISGINIPLVKIVRIGLIALAMLAAMQVRSDRKLCRPIIILLGSLFFALAIRAIDGCVFAPTPGLPKPMFEHASNFLMFLPIVWYAFFSDNILFASLLRTYGAGIWRSPGCLDAKGNRVFNHPPSANRCAVVVYGLSACWRIGGRLRLPSSSVLLGAA